MNKYDDKILFSKLSDNLYHVECQFDYDLDYVIKHKSIKLVKYFNRSIKASKGSFGCTTFNFKDKDDNAYFARNFDYHNSPAVAIINKPKNGYKSIGFSSVNFLLSGKRFNSLSNIKNYKKLRVCPFITMDGMNEKGLSIAVLELNDKPTRQKSGKDKINTPFIIRLVLDKCKNVTEAVEMFKRYDMHSSMHHNYHYQIADLNSSVIIEYVNNKMNIINSSSYLVLTNFVLTPGGDNRKTKGQDRFKLVTDYLNEHNGIISKDEGKQLLIQTKQDYYFWPTFFFKSHVTTNWSIVFDLSNLSLDVYIASDFSKAYSFQLK